MNLDSDKGRDLESNEEVAGALAALRRARQRAEEIAAATGTALIQSVDGKPVRVQPRRRADSVPPK
jgi:hypothetical protein